MGIRWEGNSEISASNGEMSRGFGVTRQKCRLRMLEMWRGVVAGSGALR